LVSAAAALEQLARTMADDNSGNILPQPSTGMSNQLFVATKCGQPSHESLAICAGVRSRVGDCRMGSETIWLRGNRQVCSGVCSYSRQSIGLTVVPSRTTH
ncbi:MAG TPA: hypothetical protein PK306_14555, partial [Aquabacterium sp.]|nr:hypothetical protein [Aquabacterium sp.]